MGKATWITYLYERTSGLEPRPLNGSFSTILPASRDRQNFPGAYAELDRLEHDATVRIRDKAVSGATPGTTCSRRRRSRARRSGCAPAR